MHIETFINEKTYLQSFASTCKTHGCEGEPVYGLKITNIDDLIFQIDDLSTNEIDVLKLIVELKDQNITSDQLPYIIEDFIQSLYM